MRLDMNYTYCDSLDERLQLYHTILNTSKENCSQCVRKGYLAAVNEGKNTRRIKTLLRILTLHPTLLHLNSYIICKKKEKKSYIVYLTFWSARLPQHWKVVFCTLVYFFFFRMFCVTGKENHISSELKRCKSLLQQQTPLSFQHYDVITWVNIFLIMYTSYSQSSPTTLPEFKFHWCWFALF